MPPAKIDAQRILLVLHGSIGDVTRALPLAGLLRAGYPKAFIAWSVEPAAAPLLEGNSAIDEVILFDRRRWWKSFGAFLKQYSPPQLRSGAGLAAPSKERCHQPLQWCAAPLGISSH